MSAGWEPGDLALYIGKTEAGFYHVVRPDLRLTKGCIYTVEQVLNGTPYGNGLVIKDHPSDHPHKGAWNVKGFRKITPPKPTAEDREIIDIMRGAPVREGV